MKLSTLKTAVARSEDAAIIPLLDETGEPYLASDDSPVTVSVVGSESKRSRDARDKQTKRVLRDRVTKLDPADLRTNRIELATAGVIAWHGIEAEDGSAIECTPANVREFLGAAEHVLTQVEDGIARHARFFAPPSAS
jgi:hypothetical protein